MLAWWLLILVLNIGAMAAVLIANRRPNRRRLCATDWLLA